MLYVSVGYPIGVLKNEDELAFYVQNNGEFFGLGSINQKIWEFCFFDPKTKDSLFQNLIENKVSEFVSTVEINRMIELKLLLKIDEKDAFKDVRNIKIYKNGFGFGLNNGSYMVVNQGQKLNLQEIDFRIWMLSDNLKASEILNKLEATGYKIDKTIFINSLFKLKTFELIRMEI